MFFQLGRTQGQLVLVGLHQRLLGLRPQVPDPKPAHQLEELGPDLGVAAAEAED